MEPVGERQRRGGGGHEVGGRLRDKRRKIQKEKDEVLKREERESEKEKVSRATERGSKRHSRRETRERDGEIKTES